MYRSLELGYQPVSSSLPPHQNCQPAENIVNMLKVGSWFYKKDGAASSEQSLVSQNEIDESA